MKMFHDKHKEFKRYNEIICLSVIISLFLQTGPVDWLWVFLVFITSFILNCLHAVSCHLADKKFRKIHNLD
jgi:diacylglycerol kinase